MHACPPQGTGDRVEVSRPAGTGRLEPTPRQAGAVPVVTADRGG